MKTKRTRNYDNYTIEFSRSMSRYGYKTYTWFVSRPNFDRSGFKSSDTVWCYTSDSSLDYEMWKDQRISKAKFICMIKSNPSTRCYNQPLY